MVQRVVRKALRKRRNVHVQGEGPLGDLGPRIRGGELVQENVLRSLRKLVHQEREIDGYGVRILVMVRGHLEVESGHSPQECFERCGRIAKTDPFGDCKRGKFSFADLPEEGQGLVDSLRIEKVEGRAYPLVQVLDRQQLRGGPDVGEHAGHKGGTGARKGEAEGEDLLSRRLFEGVDLPQNILNLVFFEKVEVQIPDEGRAQVFGLLIGDMLHVTPIPDA